MLFNDLFEWVTTNPEDGPQTPLETAFFMSFPDSTPVDLLHPRKSTQDLISCALNIPCCVFSLQCTTDCTGCDDHESPEKVEWTRVKDPEVLVLHPGQQYVVYDSRYHPHVAYVKGVIYYQSEEDCRVEIMSFSPDQSQDTGLGDDMLQPESASTNIGVAKADASRLNFRHLVSEETPVETLLFVHTYRNHEAMFYLQLSETCEDHSSVDIILGLRGMKTKTRRS